MLRCHVRVTAFEGRALDVDVGRSRSSQRGNHHAHAGEVHQRRHEQHPHDERVDEHAEGQPETDGRMIAVSEKMNPPKTEIMMIAAAVTTERPARKPSTTAVRAGAPWTYASRIPEVRKSM